jgi:hypothetical protein
MQVYMLIEEYINGFVYEEEGVDVAGSIEDAEVWTKQKAEAWIEAYKKGREYDEHAGLLKRVEDKEETGWETRYRRYVYRPRELWQPKPALSNSNETEVKKQ